MPVPFATLSTNEHHVWNLQFYFWKNALEHFEAIRDTDYDGEEGVFEVDACMAIVLAGTSVSQLLGQNVPYTERKTPNPKVLFKQFTDGVNLFSLGFGGLGDHFTEFIDIYDCIRHFGLSKHNEIRDIDEVCLCDSMATAQDVWNLVARVKGGSIPNAEYFQQTFKL